MKFTIQRVAHQWLAAKKDEGYDDKVWKDFLRAKYKDNPFVPNPNPKGARYVRFWTAMKNEAFRRKIHREFTAWAEQQRAKAKDDYDDDWDD